MTGEHRSYSRGTCHFDPTAPEHLREVNARSRHDLAMCWCRHPANRRGVRGSGDRLWAILRNWTLMTANGLAANQRGLTPKGGQPATESLRWRRSSCSSMAWAVRASRMSKRRPELVLRRSTARGSPAQGRPWSLGCSPSGCGSRRGTLLAQLRRDPSHLETALDEVLDRIEDLRPRRAQLRQ
jgi:hypothetical protein